ncbi:hypothetical protein JB92DRAFT_3011464 [Gautieria morchelliformis]|nr:hypothetical protein JB92DRAFT_3011464 [Gautieria morchelliformis]
MIYIHVQQLYTSFITPVHVIYAYFSVHDASMLPGIDSPRLRYIIEIIAAPLRLTLPVHFRWRTL